MREPGNIPKNLRYDSLWWCQSFIVPQAQFAYPGNKWRARLALGCDSWFIVSDRTRPCTVCLPRKQMTRSAVIRDSSSVSVNIIRPGLVEFHSYARVHASCETYRRHSFNVEIMLRYFGKYTKRVSVTEPNESDFPDKRQRDGIGGEASVDVAIGGETSVTVDNKPLSALSDAVCAPCHQAAVRGNDAASASLFIKALKKTSHLHENSGTVEYFAGQ